MEVLETSFSILPAFSKLSICLSIVPIWVSYITPSEPVKDTLSSRGSRPFKRRAVAGRAPQPQRRKRGRQSFPRTKAD